MSRIRLVLICVLVAILTGCGTQTSVQHKVTAAYIPPGSIFCQTTVNYVVSSPYQYEEGLLDYQQPPAADTDYMHPNLSESVCLPGLKTDVYGYYGSVYIDGSGWAAKFAVESGPDAGARFAFLHLLSTPGASSAAPLLSQMPAALHLHQAPYPGYDATGQVVSFLEHRDQPTVGTPTLMHGGTIIGKSGYPWWPQYAGGGPGGWQDAHLCVVYSVQAGDWFYRVTAGLDKPPKPKPVFPAAAWDAWRKAHHKPAIPARINGHLTVIATAWWHHHRSCGGVTGKQSWHAKPQFEQQSFSRCTAFAWTHAKGQPTKFTKR